MYYIQPDPSYYTNDPFANGPTGRCRGIAALLAIFLGSFGIQYFYLNRTTAGLLTILLFVITCGVWGTVMFIQGIYMFCIDNDKFTRIYINNTSTLPLF